MTPKASDLAARPAATAAGARPSPPPAPQSSRPASEPAQNDRQSLQVQRFKINLPKALHRFIRQFALAHDSAVSTIIRPLLSRIE
jgi:hypothetical protein